MLIFLRKGFCRYCLIGPSGCGKTTLLSCILGLKKYSGSICFYGSKVSSENLIGYMPQQVELVEKLTVKENLNYFGNIRQVEKEKLENRAEELLRLFEIKSNVLIETLSGGEKRRVGLAAALIHQPKILILDEPTVGLDVILRDKIWKFFVASAVHEKISILITTHYIYEAQFANRCAFMRNGAILTENASSEIISRLQVNTLDEAFVQLCQQNEADGFIEDELENFLEIKNNRDRKTFAAQIIFALISKEFHRFRRTPM